MIENAPREQSQEVKNQEPFTIRGHHLLRKPLDYFELKSIKEDPGSLVYGTTGSFYDYLLGLPAISVTSNPNENYTATILNDVYNSLEEYFENQKLYMQKFKDLPDNHTVMIVEGIDTMCQTCTITEHCNNHQTVKDDKKFIQTFGKFLRQSSFKMNEDYETVIDTNGKKAIQLSKFTFLQSLTSYEEYLKIQEQENDKIL